MPDDTQSLDERKNTLLAEFIFDEIRYLRLARFNYYAAQGLLWASLAASSLAALLEPLPVKKEGATSEEPQRPISKKRTQTGSSDA